MAENLILAWIGLSGGLLVAGGVVALMVGLGILSRFIQMSHTSKYVWLYEDCILLGAMAGTALTVYHVSVPFGAAGIAVLGLCCGIYVGGWIMALAEIIHVFPVFARRLRLTKGIGCVIVSIALGKTAGSMLHFFMRW